MIAKDGKREEFLFEIGLSAHLVSAPVVVKPIELNSSWVFGSFWAKPK